MAGGQLLTGRKGIRIPTVLLVAALLGLAVLTSVANAHIYWSNPSKSAIGRANLDGTVFNPDFVFTPGVGEAAPLGVAVDASHVYWITGKSEDPVTDETSPPTLWRADLDGKSLEPLLSGISLGTEPSWLAIQGEHLYWASWMGGIHRARLDGSDPEHVIPSVFGLAGIAVSSSHIYWSRWPGGTSSIGRANLDGSEPEEDFLTGLDATAGLAVDSTHVYWRSWPDKVGRANLDGSERDDDFIPVTGGFGNGLAVDSSHIYFSVGENPVGSIGRANLDGSDVRPALVTPISESGALAVDTGYTAPPKPLPPATQPSPDPPSSKFRIGRFMLSRGKGTATMMVGVAGPGVLEITGRLVRKAVRRPTARQKIAIPVVPKSDAKQRLRETGKVRVVTKVAFTPTGGSRNAESRSWQLVLRLGKYRGRTRLLRASAFTIVVTLRRSTATA